MDPITERDLRASFVNCSKGDAKRLPAPRDLDDRPWEDLDFLGWTDPAFPGRGYLVVPRRTARSVSPCDSNPTVPANPRCARSASPPTPAVVSRS